jgi:hypothetical protein
MEHDQKTKKGGRERERERVRQKRGFKGGATLLVANSKKEKPTQIRYEYRP